eukprot:1159183-Pelagomonas_calceolata.AAC.21
MLTTALVPVPHSLLCAEILHESSGLGSGEGGYPPQKHTCPCHRNTGAMQVCFRDMKGTCLLQPDIGMSATL